MDSMHLILLDCSLLDVNFLFILDGQHRTFAANVFCVLACFLAFIASYLGYLYKIALERDNPEN
jgi:hypothetical protein